jgi:hypothetical protein
MVVRIVRLDPPVLFDLKSYLEFDPTGPTSRVEPQNFPPEWLVEVARCREQFTFE